MNALEPIDAAIVEGVAAVVGDTVTGLTGSEIARLLAAAQLPDPGPITKRTRISTAVLEEQQRLKSGVPLARLLLEVMRPVRWVGRQEDFESFRRGVNETLAFAGLVIGADGQLARRQVATTLSEAQQTSRRLRDELARRRGHEQVFKYCSAELVAEDCFNVALEATKGLAERVRELSDLDLDGHKLVDAALLGDTPLLALNSLDTDTKRNEQKGFASLMKGVFSAFRNPLAHEPKVLFHIGEQDVLDLLSTLSLLHRRLDVAVRIH